MDEGEVASEPTQLISLKTSTTFGTVAIGERYVAGSTEYEYDGNDKSYYVYDRASGREVHVLNEPGVAELEDASEIYHSSFLEFAGDLLVTTSWFSGMLCIWNASAGTLLRRYNGQNHLSPALAPARPDATTGVRCMVQLDQEGTLSFLTAEHRDLRVWSFPYTFRGAALTANLANRESRLQGLRNALYWTQDPAAFGVA